MGRLINGSNPTDSHMEHINSSTTTTPAESDGNRSTAAVVHRELGTTARRVSPRAPASAPVGNGSTGIISSSAEQWVTADDGILDLTSAQLHNLEEVELPESLIELDLTANRLTEVDERIGQLTALKKLSLRQNLFVDAAVDPLMKWPALSGLQELVLRDNRLAKVSSVGAFGSLTVLDISFNKIGSMEGISQVNPKLKELYLSNNDVTEIVELDHLSELQILELGANHIRYMNGIQKLTMLKDLWLGRNRIRSVDMCGLTGLTRISLQSNLLTSMAGFQECVHLEELYLSHNFIAEMDGIWTLTQLRILDVSSNKLEAIKGLDNLTRLEDLWLNDNSISSLDEMEAALEGVRGSLSTIYLERNPCSRNLEYVKILRAMIPNLVQIDSQFFD